MAIVAVDVVGYSRLMAIDEDGTLAALRELREIIDPIFESGGGRIVKSTGDGILVEAPSVVEATRASLAAQRAVGDWNAGRAAAAPMLMRIGVNLGDVVVDDTGDIYGDGVNVAARLEGLAEPGGICISEAAHHQLRGRIDIPMTDRGEQRVKNIPRPIRVWSIDPEGVAPARRSRRRVLIPAAALVLVALIAGGSVALSRGDESSANPTTTTTSDPGEGLLSIESAAWVVGFDDPVDLVATDGETVVVSLGSGEIHALRSETGAMAWPAPVLAGTLTTLEVGDGLAVYAGSRVVHALDITGGSESWRQVLDLEGVDIAPRISITGEAVFVALGFGVERLALSDGTSAWARQVVGTQNIDAISAGRSIVAVGDGRFVHGIDPADDSRDPWEQGPPQISGGVAWVQVWVVEVEGGFSSTFEERVLVVTGDRDLVVLDARSGSVAWTRPVSGTPAVSDDLLFVAGVDGELVAFDPDRDGEDAWTDRSDVFPTWPPVVAGDYLLVVDGSRLLVINPRSGSTRASIDLGAEPTGPPVPAGDFVVLPFGSTLAAFPIDG